MRAIDADELRKCVLKWLPQDPCGKEEKEMPFETDICVSMLMEIDEQPTIQPEPHWISVKEKNPIEYNNPTEFLVTLEDPSGERYIELLMWDGYEWDEIYTDDNELGIWGQDEVIAWCKPLEPYKGVNT